MLLGAATSSGFWTGVNCAIRRTQHTVISILSTFITDLVLLSLMLIGVLRWKEARQKGGVWWVLYTQVGLSHPAGATLILMTIGLGMGCGYHTCGTSPLGAYIQTDWYISLTDDPQVFVILNLNGMSISYPCRDCVVIEKPLGQFLWIWYVCRLDKERDSLTYL